jgi:serine/threonine-protein kinase
MTQPTRQPAPGQDGSSTPPPGPAEDPGAAIAPAELEDGTSKKIPMLGDFKLIKKLGSGGMGKVYKGHQISLDRDAAIKVMAKHLARNPAFVERFYREARLMARLDHPNIIRSYGVGEDHGYHYLAMEYVNGGSLQDLLKREGKLSVGDATHVILACARALEHAHAINVIHRDIKPANILLTRKGVVKVADLGLAKAVEEDVTLTRSGIGAGTPHYMAPEQASNAKNADARSDIYALGCMFYCLLTGRPPFTGETTLELLKAKEAAEIPPVRRLNHDVPERLDLMIGKMAARKPERRYQSCTELIRDLEGLGVANPVLSCIDEATRLEVRPRAATPPPATKPAVESPTAEVWFVTILDNQRKPTVKRLTTDQVKLLIKEKRLNADSPTCRKQGEQPRPLVSFREFEPLLRAHLAKEAIDRKADGSMKKLYQEMAAKERFKRRWGWLLRLWKSTSGVLVMTFWIAVLLGALGGGVWVVWRYTLK